MPKATTDKASTLPYARPKVLAPSSVESKDSDALKFPLPAEMVNAWSPHLLFRVYPAPSKTREGRKYMKGVIAALKARGVHFLEKCSTIPTDEDSLVHICLYRTVPQSPFLPHRWNAWSVDRLWRELVRAEAELLTFVQNDIAFPPCRFPIPANWLPFFFGESKLGQHLNALLQQWELSDSTIPAVNTSLKGTLAYRMLLTDVASARGDKETRRETRRAAADIVRSLASRCRSTTPTVYREDVSMPTVKRTIAQLSDIEMESLGTHPAASVDGEGLVYEAERDEAVQGGGSEAGSSHNGVPDRSTGSEEEAQKEGEAVQPEDEEWEDAEEEPIKKGDKKGKGRMGGERRRKVMDKDVASARSRESTPPTSPKATSTPGSPVKVRSKKTKGVKK